MVLCSWQTYSSLRYGSRSAKADENIRAIGPADLPAAVDACIDAAGHEFDVAQQKALLRAAAYGRAFCAKFPRDRFQEVCKVGGSGDARLGVKDGLQRGSGGCGQRLNT